MTDQKFKTVEVKAPWITKINGTLNIQDVIQMVKHKSNIQYKQCFTAEHDKTIFKVWNTLSTFIKEQMLAKKNVNIRDFGSFSFDIATENPSSLKNNCCPCHHVCCSSQLCSRSTSQLCSTSEHGGCTSQLWQLQHSGSCSCQLRHCWNCRIWRSICFFHLVDVDEIHNLWILHTILKLSKL